MILVPVAADVRVAMIVREDEQDVRFRLGGGELRQQQGGE
jgi:hypothetical protein